MRNSILSGALILVLAVATAGCGGLNKAKTDALKTKSLAHLKQIGTAIQMFTANEGKFPPDLKVLLKDDMIPKNALDHPDKEGTPAYLYVSGLSEEDDGEFILVAEKKGTFEGGRNVLLVNATVKWMEEAAFEAALKKTVEGAKSKKAKVIE